MGEKKNQYNMVLTKIPIDTIAAGPITREKIELEIPKNKTEKEIIINKAVNPTIEKIKAENTVKINPSEQEIYLKGIEMTITPTIEKKVLFDTEEKAKDSYDYDGFNSSRKIVKVERLQKIEEDLKDIQLVEDLNLGFFDYVHYYTGLLKSDERDKKKMIILKGSQIIKNFLDIKYIIQKFYEIEKLKQILLHEEDLVKFEILPKPEIRVIQEKQANNGKLLTSVMTSVLNKRFDFDSEMISPETAKDQKK